jgi:hypothetical protein
MPIEGLGHQCPDVQGEPVAFLRTNLFVLWDVEKPERCCGSIVVREPAHSWHNMQVDVRIPRLLSEEHDVRLFAANDLSQRNARRPEERSECGSLFSRELIHRLDMATQNDDEPTWQGAPTVRYPPMLMEVDALP